MSYSALAVRDSFDGRVIGQEVVAERVSGHGKGCRDPAREREQGQDRQRGARQPGDDVAVHHTRSVALR